MLRLRRCRPGIRLDDIEDFGSWWGKPVKQADRGRLLHQLLTSPGHPRSYTALCAAAVLFLAWGPVSPGLYDDWSGKLRALVVPLLGLAIVNMLAHHHKHFCRCLLAYQAVVLALLALFVGFAGWNQAATKGGVYAHVGLLLFVLLVLALVVDWRLARCLFQQHSFSAQLTVWAAMESRR